MFWAQFRAAQLYTISSIGNWHPFCVAYIGFGISRLGSQIWKPISWASICHPAWPACHQIFIIPFNHAICWSGAWKCSPSSQLCESISLGQPGPSIVHQKPSVASLSQLGLDIDRSYRPHYGLQAPRLRLGIKMRISHKPKPRNRKRKGWEKNWRTQPWNLQHSSQADGGSWHHSCQYQVWIWN